MRLPGFLSLPSVNLKVISFFFLIVAFTSLHGNLPGGLPSYEKGKEILIELLPSLFPVPEGAPVWEISLSPKGKRILRKHTPKGPVYFYRYIVKIPVYTEKEIQPPRFFREETLWLKVTREQTQITFLREDLLEGTNPLFIE